MFKLIICTEKRMKQVINQAILESYWTGHLDGYTKAMKDQYLAETKGRLQAEVDEILRGSGNVGK